MSALASPLKGANGIGDEAGDAQKALEAESPMRETAGTSAVHDHSAADDETVARDDPPANEAGEVEDEAGDEVAEERDPCGRMAMAMPKELSRAAMRPGPRCGRARQFEIDYGTASMVPST